MLDALISSVKLKAIADAIRHRTGATGKLKVDDMPDAIESIRSVLGHVRLVENGKYQATNFGLEGFSSVNVDLPEESDYIHEFLFNVVPYEVIEP